MTTKGVESSSEKSIWQTNLEAQANKFMIRWMDYDDVGRDRYNEFIQHVREPVWEDASKEEVVTYGETILSGYTDSGLLVCVRLRQDGLELLDSEDRGIESDVPNSYFVLLADVLTGRSATPPIISGSESRDGDGAKLEFTISVDNPVRGQVDVSLSQSSCTVVSQGRTERLGGMNEIINARYAHQKVYGGRALIGAILNEEWPPNGS